MDVHELKKKFLSEIENTQKKIGRYEELAQPVAPDNAIGRVSRMDAINNKGVMDAALRKAKQRLEGLRRHLEKLSDADFGLCVKCNKKIPEQRIFLAPESPFCVDCARK